MLKYGFFDSIEHDRQYNARDISRMFDGIILDGVFMYCGDAFRVKSTSNSSLMVQVGTGQAWFDHTRIYNTTPMDFVVKNPIGTKERIDSLVFVIDEEKRQCSIEYRLGEEVVSNSQSYTPPAYKQPSETYHVHEFARVHVQPTATHIEDNYIEDLIGVELDYVVSPNRILDPDRVISYWKKVWDDWRLSTQKTWDTWFSSTKNEWSTWETNTKNAWNKWFGDTKDEWTRWLNATKKDWGDWFSDTKTEWTTWETNTKNSWNTWFSNSQDSFDTFMQNSRDTFTDQMSDWSDMFDDSMDTWTTAFTEAQDQRAKDFTEAQNDRKNTFDTFMDNSQNRVDDQISDWTDLFDESMSDWSTAFSEAQTARDTTFKNSEASRTTAFNNSEKSRDTTFKASEKSRSDTFSNTMDTIEDQWNTFKDDVLGVLRYKGSCTFAELKTKTNQENGWYYNVTTDFTTDATFVEGAGLAFKAGTNVVWVKDLGKWDIFTVASYGPYLELTGGTVTGKANFKGGLSLAGLSEGPNKQLPFILGCNEFSSGGDVYWLRPNDVANQLINSLGSNTNTPTDNDSIIINYGNTSNKKTLPTLWKYIKSKFIDPQYVHLTTAQPNFDTTFRTTLLGSSADGQGFRILRSDVAIADRIGPYGIGLAAFGNDTQMFIGTDYSSAKAWIGGGNKNVLQWCKQIAFVGDRPKEFAVASGGANSPEFKVTPSAIEFYNDCTGSSHQYSLLKMYPNGIIKSWAKSLQASYLSSMLIKNHKDHDILEMYGEANNTTEYTNIEIGYISVLNADIKRMFIATPDNTSNFIEFSLGANIYTTVQNGVGTSFIYFETDKLALGFKDDSLNSNKAPSNGIFIEGNKERFDFHFNHSLFPLMDFINLLGYHNDVSSINYWEDETTNVIIGGLSNVAKDVGSLTATKSISSWYSIVLSGTANNVRGRCSGILAGTNNRTSGDYSAVIGGTYCESLGCCVTTGHYNDPTKGGTVNSGMSTGTTGSVKTSHWNSSEPTSGTSTYTAFEIGNGTSSANSNAFRVDYNGKAWCKAAYSSSGADYAEYFEWFDGNPDKDNRIGYFVTLEEDKIKIANAGDWVLGIVSANPCVVGNTDIEWQGQFLKDEFGAYIIEDFEETVINKRLSRDENGDIVYEEVPRLDKNGNQYVDEEGKPEYKRESVYEEYEETITGKRYKLNPDYDPNREYESRDSRPEWSTVGMMGQLVVYDDGTCEVNGFCKVADGGIATRTDDRRNGYRVIKRISDNLVKVVFK